MPNPLEQSAIYLIREAYAHNRNMALLWSMGKDSTVLLWLCRKAFFGKIPFPVLHIDTTFKFPEMYAFREKWEKEWGLNLIVAKNEEALKKGINYENTSAIECCHQLKTIALQQAIKKHNYGAVIVGIRGDEHGIRAKERFISPRNEKFEWDYKNQPPEMWSYFMTQAKPGCHLRVHPLLEWTELDVWKYIQQESIPVNKLYFADEGKRYRSLGCMPITHSIPSKANTIEKIITEIQENSTDERSGRDQDKEREFAMQKLRSLGYM